MIWVIQTKRGVFEGSTKRQVVNDMIEHYGSNDHSAEQIEAIFIEKKNGKTDELCQDAVSKIQDLVDSGVEKWRKIADQENVGRREIERDFMQRLDHKSFSSGTNWKISGTQLYPTL